MLENVGHALLVGIALYFYYNYGMPLWATVGFILFALGTWNTPVITRERRELLRSLIRVLDRLEKVLYRLEEMME